MKKNIKITQIRSAISCSKKHKATLRGLGLRHIGHTVIREDTSSIRGMINKIYYIVKIESIEK